MEAPPRIQPGESLSFSFDREGLSLEGWTCEIFVKQYPGDTATINRFIPANGKVFDGYLTQSETSTLAPGGYLLIAKLVNLTDDKLEEITRRFTVAPLWA